MITPANMSPMAEMLLLDPAFNSVVWRVTPASMAVRLARGNWRVAPHLELLSRELVSVALGETRYLIVTMPPRHGKSELVSHWLPVWYLDTFPKNRIILSSYSFDFAAKWGAKVRESIKESQDLLRVRFKTKMPSAADFQTSMNGGMACAGVGGAITGKGADLFIIDDPVKNSEEANSFTVREAMWEWWTSTARTRLEPGASVVVVMTRWHEDDLVGRLTDPLHAGESAKMWKQIDFPMVADEYYFNDLELDPHEDKDQLGRSLGDTLWPWRYDEGDAKILQESVGKRVWASLYQGRPADTADDGNVYYGFSRLDHVNKEVGFDPRLPIAVSLDFNVDPMSAVIGQYEKGTTREFDQAWVMEEIVQLDSNTYRMCDELRDRLKKYQVGFTLRLEIFGDAAGTQKSANSRRTNWQIVKDFFSGDPNLNVRYKIRRANPAITDRVDSVNTMFKSVSGNIRLRVHPRCEYLVKDLLKVRWAIDSGGNPRSQLDKSNKMRTHVSDALGYWIEMMFSATTRGGLMKGFMR